MEKKKAVWQEGMMKEGCSHLDELFYVLKKNKDVKTTSSFLSQETAVKWCKFCNKLSVQTLENLTLLMSETLHYFIQKVCQAQTGDFNI